MARITFEDFLLSRCKKAHELWKQHPNNEKFKLVYYIYFETILWYNKTKGVNIWKNKR